MSLIKRSPEYGNIICRCEMISEGEILDAIRKTAWSEIPGRSKTSHKSGMEDVSQASALPEQWKSSAESLAFPWRRSKNRRSFQTDRRNQQKLQRRARTMNDKIMVKRYRDHRRRPCRTGSSPGCKERGSREYPDPGT